MQKYATGKVIAVNASIWGILTMCMAASRNYGGFAALRFILGLSEALTFPGFGLVISGWYTKKEQVWRVAILYSTLSSFTNGILACAFPLTSQTRADRQTPRHLCPRPRALPRGRSSLSSWAASRFSTAA